MSDPPRVRVTPPAPPHTQLTSCSPPPRKNQQYDSKWCIPLTELTFQAPEEVEPLTVPQVPDEELDALKVKISHIRSELQKEKVFVCTLRLLRLLRLCRDAEGFSATCCPSREPTRVQR